MTTAGKRIIGSAQEALDFVQGQTVAGTQTHIPHEIDVKRIRKKVAMTQKDFALHFGVSIRTVQDWEQGRRVPSGASRSFLIVIDKEPEAVSRALCA